MVQIAQSHQYPIKKFSDLEQGAAALGALQDAGFSVERLSLVPEELNSTPKLSQTVAAENAGKGAAAGTVVGAIAGFWIAGMSLNDPAAPSMLPMTQLISYMLIGSGVGAAGFAAIAAISGGSVNKSAVEDSTAEQSFLLLIDGTTPEEVNKAQQVLQQFDSRSA